MQISGAFPIIFGAPGGKGVREKTGRTCFGHLHTSDARFAYGEICIPRRAPRRGTRAPVPVGAVGPAQVDRKKFGYRYVLLLALVSSSHTYAYARSIESDGGARGGAEWDGVVRGA